MTKTFLTLAFAAAIVVSLPAAPMGSSFTYQGRLNDNGAPAPNGLYDFQFTLYDAVTTGSIIAGPTSVSAVPVTNGLFTAQLDFGTTAWTSDEARWLELKVNTNTVLPLATLAPRQRVTPTPQAIFAGNAASAAIASGVTLGAVTGSGLAAGSVGSATIADDSIAAGDLSPALLNNTFWKLGGNGGTDPNNNFLGTTDNVALTLRINNQRVLRLEPDVSPRFIGGHSANQMTLPGIWGGTIGGGGAADAPNLVSDDFGTVGGGAGNRAGNSNGIIDDAAYSTVSGGSGNAATNRQATVGGGIGNLAGAPFSTVGGGNVNRATGQDAVVSGGSGNAATNGQTTVGGGIGNIAGGLGATIGGGYTNLAAGQDSTVAGGTGNRATGQDAVASGGSGNAATNGQSTVGGGIGNVAGGLRSTVGGGINNFAGASFSTVSGGNANQATGQDAVVSGGSGNAATNGQATVGGGIANVAGGPSSTVSGGNANQATGQDAVVSGGSGNKALGGQTAVSGGIANTASGTASTVVGGQQNSATNDFSVASGHGGITRLPLAQAAGAMFATPGDAQSAQYTLTGQTAGLATLNLLGPAVPVSGAIAFSAVVSAKAFGDFSGGFEVKGIISNYGGGVSFVGTPTVTILGRDSGTLNVTALVSGSQLALQVTGITGLNVRWVATLRTSEVVF